MKYCTHCGAEIDEAAVVCVNCGCAVENQNKSSNDTSTLDLIIKIFMILGCIAWACAFLIPLCWCIPMTLYLFNKRDKGEPVGIGFKVCALLFVNLIAGILLLCRSEEQ